MSVCLLCQDIIKTSATTRQIVGGRLSGGISHLLNISQDHAKVLLLLILEEHSMQGAAVKMCLCTQKCQVLTYLGFHQRCHQPKSEVCRGQTDTWSANC
eukprot:4054599-Amphidinium_carterae.3